MIKALLTVPDLRAPNGAFARQSYFDLLLTGVRLTLLCRVANAREIGLFGFNFYEGTAKQPSSTQDLAFEKQLLAALIEIAPRLGSRIVKFDR